jgi:hypothetical protein
MSIFDKIDEWRDEFTSRELYKEGLHDGALAYEIAQFQGSYDRGHADGFEAAELEDHDAEFHDDLDSIQ